MKTIRPRHIYSHLRRGFTVVELLVVIVVIGVLAAITFVAYNGITQDAKVSSVMSNLSQALKVMESYRVKANGQYPADLAALEAAGVKQTDAVDYQYQVNNTVRPYSYCITATVDTESYYITEDTGRPEAGGCPGDGVGGLAAITNLAVNPRAVSSGDSGEWLPRYSMVRTWVSGASDGPTDELDSYARQTQSAAVTGSGRGIDHRGNVDVVTPSTDARWQVVSGQQVYLSSYIRASVANTQAQLLYRIHNGAGTWLTSTQGGPTQSYATPGTWIRISATFTAPTNGYLHISSRLQQSVTWGAGATIDTTGLMIVTGSSGPYTYADGTSSNWIWNGTPDNSSSTGPQLD